MTQDPIKRCIEALKKMPEFKRAVYDGTLSLHSTRINPPDSVLSEVVDGYRVYKTYDIESDVLTVSVQKEEA